MHVLRRKSGVKKRIVSLFMALVMTLSLLPTAVWAVQPSPETTEQTLTEQTAEPSVTEEPQEEAAPVEVQPVVESADTKLTDSNSFLLFAATNAGVLIAPERVPYQPGQTVRAALLALRDRGENPHTFDGLETANGFITAIDGVTANYSRSDDKGTFDLEQRADAVGAFLFVTAYGMLDEDTASALYALGRAMLAWQEAEKPQMQKFAQKEYDAAAKALTVKKTADELTALAKALTERMEDYDRYENAKTVPLTVGFYGLDGQPLTEYVFTATDPYGNEKTFTNALPALAAGSYTFTLTSGLNGASGDMTVAEDGSVTVAGQTLTTLRIPQGVAWMAQPVLRSVNGGDAAENRYPMEPGGTVALVPDTVGPTGGLYLYGVPGADLTEKTWLWQDIEVDLYAMYTDINGKKIEKQPGWESTHKALPDLLTAGTQGSDLHLEARAAIDGYTLYQTWELKIERTPTLYGLSVTAGGIDQKLDFSGTKTEYTCVVTTESVVLRPARNSSYTVTVNDRTLDDDGTYTLPLKEDGDTTAAIAVTMPENRRTTTYTLTVTRKAAVPLTVEHDDDVTVRIFNAAGVEVGKDADGTYPLTPGDSSYTYIATKNEYYHTKGTFKAPAVGAESLTITAVTPETTDRLISLQLTSYRSSTDRGDVYLSADRFSADSHKYDAQLDDVYNSVYVWATAEKGCTIRVVRVDGKETSVTSGSQYGVYARCVTDGPEPSCVTLHVSRQDTAQSVTFEQDYLVNFTKVLTLYDMALSVDGAETPFYRVQEDGKVTEDDAFDDEVYAYQATVIGSAQEAVLTVKPFVTGYNVQVNGGQVCEPEVDPETGETAETITVTLPLDEAKKQEAFTLTACTADGQQAHAYTLTLKKGAPVDTTITIQDKNTKQTIGGALAAVYEKRSGSRVWPGDDGTFSLVEGLTYTCVATCSGYVGVTKDITAGEAGAITVSLTAAPAASHGAGVTSRWPSFRGNENANAVVNSKIPTTSKDAVLSWAQKLGEGFGSGAVGCPILIEENGVEFLIVYSGKTLYKVESVTGTVVARGDMCGTSSFAITSATYGPDCGMLFVALSGGVVQAFDAATLKSLWIYRDPLGGQPNCPLTYHNGYVYTGFWNKEKEDANFVCLSVTDEEPASENETKLARWTYTRQGGFYWAGAYVCDDYLLVGADDGEDQYFSATGALLCLDPSTGAELARWDGLQGDVRSSVAKGEDGRFYFTSKGGYLYSAAVEKTAAGWTITNKRFCQLSNGSGSEKTPAMSTCTPVLYNGRAYIGVSGTSQFNAYTGHNITVVDINSMKVVYSVPTKGYPQTSGLLTTAYGVPCVYFFDNFLPGTLRLLEDAGTGPSKTTTETYQEGGSTRTAEMAYALFTPANDQAEYAICSPISDSKGTVFFKNDSAYLMALTSTVADIEMTEPPKKMTYAAGEEFKPDGMQLTVHYTNGESRTLPVSRTINGVKVEYFTYSTTVTADDNGYFELTYAPVLYQSGADGEPLTVTKKVSVPITVTGGETPKQGDINGDGAVDVYDLQYLYEYCCDTSTITNPAILARVDVNGDGQKNISDVAALYDFLTQGSWPKSDTSATVAQTTAASGGGTAKLLAGASSAKAIDRAALRPVAGSLSSAPAAAAVKKGDINGDGAVDVYDLQYLYEYCCDNDTITNPAILDRVDVNGDGKRDISDTAALYSYLTEGAWPSSGHAITVKADAPTKAEVPQGGQYILCMSDVFDICPDNDVAYTMPRDGLGEHTKLVSDDKGDYLSFTNSETGEYSLTITAVCGADSTVRAVYHLTVTVTEGAAGDDRQYNYKETNADEVTVYVTISNNGVPIRGYDGTPISHLKVTVPYFDLEEQGLDSYYRYHTENGRGGYVDANVVERPTVLHLYLYLLGVYCLGYSPEDVTTGAQKIVDQESSYQKIVNILGEADTWSGPALTLSGGATSMYMTHFWGHDENLMYYRNHVYPLMGPSWGSTADYILLDNGDTIDVALFTDWDFWSDGGAFTCFDADAYTVKAGEELSFKTLKYETKSVADGGSESFLPIEGMNVYLCNENWDQLDAITPDEGNAYRYETGDLAPGDYYLLAVDPKAGGKDARCAPATARLSVS